MQFIPKGPIVPDPLIQAHEDGKVVFFCGAGISRYAGLPDFKGLVKQVLAELSIQLEGAEKDAFKRGQFDVTFDLLEQRLSGGRSEVRSAIANVLRPKDSNAKATSTHAALLELARNRKDVCRLVTTNYDRLFEKAASATGVKIESYTAPLLPIPKHTQWNGIAYLHGLLPSETAPDALDKLIVTSGDFGRAYLLERWAARFVTELFRNHTVCFVGYSVGDQVLRYLMDALAADRRMGESRPQAFAFAGASVGTEKSVAASWRARGIEPILYECSRADRNHSVLHQTLHSWSQIYRSGIYGLESVVVALAMSQPSQSTKEDDFVGRMVHAISHPSGLPAKRFAEFDPVPPLEWLDQFSVPRFSHEDLERFGISPGPAFDRSIRFSLISRPFPPSFSRPMSLFEIKRGLFHSDPVMFQLQQWLVRHIDDSRLLLWLCQKGDSLCESLAYLIEKRIREIIDLERDRNSAEIALIRSRSPCGVPRGHMRLLWRLLVRGRIKSTGGEHDLFQWKEKFKREGPTTTLRLQLRELLAPKVSVGEPWKWAFETQEKDRKEQLKDLVRAELALTSDHVRSSLQDFEQVPEWIDAQPLLLPEYQQLLTDALDLISELHSLDGVRNPTIWALPSISSHRQNEGCEDWVVLVELLRDAWIATHKKNPSKADHIARLWFWLPYPLFKRLALFAASQDGVSESRCWVDWMLADDAWCLWAFDTQRETLRLLALQGHRLEREIRDILEAAIIRGPPESMYASTQSKEAREEWASRAIAARLRNLTQSSKAIDADGLANDRDEFPIWISDSSDPSPRSRRQWDPVPADLSDLVEWLKREKPASGRYVDSNWSEFCREHICKSTRALGILACAGIWPVDRWNEAFFAWGNERLVTASWRLISQSVRLIPDGVLNDLLAGLSWWLETVSKTLRRNEEILITLCRRVVALPQYAGSMTDEPVTRAINHPVGHVTQALVNRWFDRKPSDGESLPPEFKEIFSNLCRLTTEQFRHGRVILAANCIALFRVDYSWTTSCLLPLFSWEKYPTEAANVWAGFLWGPRIYNPLLALIRDDLLETANHYETLGRTGPQLAAFLTYAALDPSSPICPDEFRAAISKLPAEGLVAASHALLEALNGAALGKEEYWRLRIEPFWKRVWPNHAKFKSEGIALNLAYLCIGAGKAFPLAFQTVVHWLIPVLHINRILQLLTEAKLTTEFPNEALALLYATCRSARWPSHQLRTCLEAILEAQPRLVSDRFYRELDEVCRRNGD